MHFKAQLKKEDLLEQFCKPNTNMASSLLNEDEDNATRNTQQQQQLQQQHQNNNYNSNNNCISSPTDNNNLNETSLNSTSNNMQDNEAKLKKQNLEQRKQELEKLLNEKSWLLQQLQKQESQILNGNFEYMNFNDFIQDLAIKYKQEQTTINSNSANSGDTISTLSGGTSNHLTSGEEAILRRKPLTAKENYQNLNNNNSNNNVLHRRQSEISNRSSEYDNYPQNDNQSTHSEGGRGAVMHNAAQANQQQYSAKAALKKRSATVAGTTAQSSSNLQMIRQHHLEQQQQQLLYKQQQQQQHHQQPYHHPQQHLFKQQHQVLMPHLQYATHKFYYTTLQPQPQPQSQLNSTNHQQLQLQQLQHQQQQQQQYGRYIQNKQIAQQQTQHHNQTAQQNINNHQQQILLTTPTNTGLTIDNISLYSLNSNNVATLHRPAQQQQPIIVQCDKYYLSPTSHHISHNDGGGFIKSSQNIKEYISPHNSPQQHLNLRDKNRTQTSQSNSTAQRGATPALDIISLAPSYVSMETIDYSTSPIASNMRWRSQTNLPPMQNAGVTGDMKSQSSDMLNNNQYYNTALNPPPPPPPTNCSLLAQNQNLVPPPNVTQVKPFKPLDDISVNSYSTETQKKLKPKQWLESSLDGPIIRQTPVHEDPCSSTSFSANNNSQTRTKLSSQSLTTARHYSMSAAQSKINHNQKATTNPNHIKLSQSTSYLNQMDIANANMAATATPTPTPSISQAYNLELSPQTSTAYHKFLTAQQNIPARPPPHSTLYVNTSNTNLTHSATPTPPLAAALSPDIRIESPVNMTVVQPATFQPYKEVTKPFEMSDFYKYSTKFRQKENKNNNNLEN